MSTPPSRILVVGPAWIGDMVIAHSLLQLIRSRFDAPLDVLAPSWTHPLLSRMREVDEAIRAPFEHGRLHLTRRWKMARELKTRGYERAFVLPNSWKSALVPFLAHIPTRTGFIGEQRYGLLNDTRRLDETAMPLMSQRYIALLRQPDEPAIAVDAIPPPRLEVSKPNLDSSLSRFSLTLDRPVLALCPGAEFGPAKQWPESHYAEVARHFLERGYAVWLFGSGQARKAADEVNRLCSDGCRNLAGQTTLSEAIDLLSRASLVISNDSGLMHIAAALGRTLIAVFGSTDPDHTPPLSPRAEIVRRDDLPCSPCFQKVCPLEHLACLRGLEADRVIEASSRLLDAA